MKKGEVRDLRQSKSAGTKPALLHKGIKRKKEKGKKRNNLEKIRRDAACRSFSTNVCLLLNT